MSQIYFLWEFQVSVIMLVFCLKSFFDQPDQKLHLCQIVQYSLLKKQSLQSHNLLQMRGIWVPSMVSRRLLRIIAIGCCISFAYLNNTFCSKFCPPHHLQYHHRIIISIYLFIYLSIYLSIYIHIYNLYSSNI